MSLLIRIISLALGFILFFAGWDGITYILSINSIATCFIALLLLWIFPLIFLGLSVYGAVNVWGWSIWGALLLALWPLVFMITTYGVSALFSVFVIFKRKTID